MEAKSEISDGSLLLLVAFLLVNAPSYHLSLVLASVVQGDAVNCNTTNNFPKPKNLLRTEKRYVGKAAIKINTTDTRLGLFTAR